LPLSPWRDQYSPSDELKGTETACGAGNWHHCPPGEIRFADALPKTRSGKIIRRFLRNLASGEEIAGDASTMEDQSVLEQLREG
jgi:acetyl-CoA synthetase